ncbi:SOS response-associated peptidase family protein [Glaciecola sp. SC05]|uniref:SOS response-associated peptidase family protein n=1 Tax=Glaciecola sp. SC05 TaxID=1987355 RepID=UPI0035284196
MCGYVGYNNSTIQDKPDLFGGFARLFQQPGNFDAYPAFGGDINRRVPLLIQERGEDKWVNAIWWFDGMVEDKLTYLGSRTSFNARNLNSPYWKAALEHSRGCIIASEIGESKLLGKTKHQYLLSSDEPFLLGALYRKLENGDYCCAVITRDAHPKMAPYHDKAFPLFLPIQETFLRDWLSPQVQASASIDALLAQPKLFPTLRVQRVKTYKDKQPIGQVNDVLLSDLVQQEVESPLSHVGQQKLF